MKATLAAVLVFICCLGGASCAHVSPPAGVTLQVDSNVPDSTIWVDDILVGTVAAWAREGRHLRAGFHRVEIRAPGTYSIFKEIDQPDGGHVTIEATLRPLLE
jgi:hypothetical protein